MKKTLILAFVATAMLFATSCKRTNDSNVVVRTVPAYDITHESFKTGVEITPSDAGNYKLGVCCSSLHSDLTIQNSFIQTGNPVSFDELIPNAQYYYRAFAAFDENGNGQYDKFIYGNILCLNTEEEPLRVYTYDCEVDSWYNRINVYGKVEGGQMDQVNQVGFCYSEENEYPQYESDLYVVAGTPTGQWSYWFESKINILSGYHKYYIRAYARMTDTIQYGNVETVVTY